MKMVLSNEPLSTKLAFLAVVCLVKFFKALDQLTIYQRPQFSFPGIHSLSRSGTSPGIPLRKENFMNFG